MTGAGSLRFVVVVAVGVVAGTIVVAQNPPLGDVPEAAGRKALRERVIALRVEVELLQIDHDADRAGLLDLMKGQRKGDPIGLGQNGLEGLAMMEFDAILGDEESLDSMKEVTEALQKEDAGMDGLKSAQKALKKFARKRAESLQVRIDRAKKDFARQAAALEGKKLDLADLEARYAAAK